MGFRSNEMESGSLKMEREDWTERNTEECDVKDDVLGRKSEE